MLKNVKISNPSSITLKTFPNQLDWSATTIMDNIITMCAIDTTGA